MILSGKIPRLSGLYRSASTNCGADKPVDPKDKAKFAELFPKTEMQTLVSSTFPVIKPICMKINSSSLALHLVNVFIY
jgi:hypothetical protein